MTTNFPTILSSLFFTICENKSQIFTLLGYIALLHLVTCLEDQFVDTFVEFLDGNSTIRVLSHVILVK
jgi:hypothetical protein